MSKFQRFVSFFGSVGVGLAGFRVAPMLWDADPIRAFAVLGCVFIVSMGWLLEALTGEKHV